MKQSIIPFQVLASTIAGVLPVYAGWRHLKQEEQEMCPDNQCHGPLLTSLLQRVLFPTLFRVVKLSLGSCFFMSPSAKAARESGKVIAFEKDIDLHIPLLGGYLPFVWSPDSRYIAFSKGVELGIVNIETDEVCEIPGLRMPYVNNLAWSPDQKLLALASRDELRIVRIADGKVVNQFSAIRDLPAEPQVRVSKMEFSEDSKKLVIASLWHTDYALLNSFDLATNTLTPLLYPPGKPLVPPPGFDKWSSKRVDTEDFRFTRYQGHLYYIAIMRRLQEYWDYAQTFPRGKRGQLDVGGNTAMPVICMVADLGDGKEVRSVRTLNFPEYTLKPGIQLQDQSECIVSRAHYFPPSNALVVLRASPSTRLPDGSWQWSPNQMFETFTLNHQSVARFDEHWFGNYGVISEQVLYPFKPLILYGQLVPIDDKLRNDYLNDGKLKGKVPITVELVLWDIMSGKEVDRISRHQSYPEYKNSQFVGLSTDPISISLITKVVATCFRFTKSPLAIRRTNHAK
jgi:hypothetical protein